MAFKLVSFAFNDGDEIPDRYAHKVTNLSPPLAWENAPERTQSFALIMDDPDAPSGLFTHWTVYGMPPGTQELSEGQRAEPGDPGPRKQGRNDFGEYGYGGPDPPSGVHRYFFHLYALDIDLDLKMGATRKELDRAMEGHILQEAVLMGRYEHLEV